MVAEGVENPQHLGFLHEQGCELAQGYWFSRPRPAALLERLFSGEECFEGLWCLLDERSDPPPAAPCESAVKP